MNRKRIIIILSITLLFLFVYTTLSVKAVNNGFSLNPHWSVLVNNTEIDAESANLHTLGIPYKTAQHYGYISPDGTILQKKPYTYNAAISTTYNAEYTESSTDFSLFNMQEELAHFEVAGFPFFDKDRIFVFLPGGNSVAQFAPDAARLWTYEQYTPITAFDSSSNGSIIGFADGNLVGLLPNGEKRFSFYPGGSEHEVVFGAAISESGFLTAAISGLDKQRFTVSKYADGQNKIIFHTYLDSEVLEQTAIQFSLDESSVYFNTADGLGIFNFETEDVLYIPLKGKILTVEELHNAVLAVLSVENNTYRISFIEDEKYMLGSFQFDATNAHMIANEDALYITRGETVSKVTLEKE